MAGAGRRGGLAALVLFAACGRFGFDEADPELVFIDGDGATFDLGQYESGTAPLEFRDGYVQLAEPLGRNAVGVYVSRSFDSRVSDSVWETLSWKLRAPTGKPLVDDAGEDRGYDEDGVDMAGATLLYHLDGQGSPAQASVVPDRSGSGHDGQIVLQGQNVTHVPGVFGEGLDIDRDAFVSMDGTFFDYGVGDFTYAIWVKNFDCSKSNDNRVAMGGGGVNDQPHMWIGALCPDQCGGDTGAFMNFLDDTRTGPSLPACTGVSLGDGGWHHLAGVKQGHTNPPAVVKLFVDGREVRADSFDFGASTHTYAGGELRIGGFNLGGTQYNTRITVDEAAIWKRALGADEVTAVYRRGAMQLGLQIRVCPDGVCDTEEFIGPDGTSATEFTELDAGPDAETQVDNLRALNLVGPILQYRVRFATATDVSPALSRIKLVASLPSPR